MFRPLRNLWNKPRRPSTPKAHPPKSIQAFVELLTRSGLATNQEANEWVALFRAENPAASDASNAMNAFCNFLISNERVTERQCEKLKLGQWKGLI